MGGGCMSYRRLALMRSSRGINEKCGCQQKLMAAAEQHKCEVEALTLENSRLRGSIEERDKELAALKHTQRTANSREQLDRKDREIDRLTEELENVREERDLEILRLKALLQRLQQPATC